MKTRIGASCCMVSLLLACASGGAQSQDKAIFDTGDHNIVKRSRNNICHDNSSAAFQNTIHYRAYRTMQDCLDSGGQRAKS